MYMNMYIIKGKIININVGVFVTYNNIITQEVKSKRLIIKLMNSADSVEFIVRDVQLLLGPWKGTRSVARSRHSRFQWRKPFTTINRRDLATWELVSL